MVTHKKTPTGYSLTRDWFNFAANNYGKVSPTDGILFLYIVDLCNRLNWKPQFGIPTTGAMEAIGVKSWRAYNKALHNLIEFGFIRMVQPSTNQYTANIIAIDNKSVAPSEAEALALTIAQQEHGQQQCSNTADIDKPKNLEPEKPSNLETLETGGTFLQSGEKSPPHSNDSAKRDSTDSIEQQKENKGSAWAINVLTSKFQSEWSPEVMEAAIDFIECRDESNNPIKTKQLDKMAEIIDGYLNEGGDEFALVSNIGTASIAGHATFFVPKII